MGIAHMVDWWFYWRRVPDSAIGTLPSVKSGQGPGVIRGPEKRSVGEPAA